MRGINNSKVQVFDRQEHFLIHIIIKQGRSFGFYHRNAHFISNNNNKFCLLHNFAICIRIKSHNDDKKGADKEKTRRKITYMNGSIIGSHFIHTFFHTCWTSFLLYFFIIFSCPFEHTHTLLFSHSDAVIIYCFPYPVVVSILPLQINLPSRYSCGAQVILEQWLLIIDTVVESAL